MSFGKDAPSGFFAQTICPVNSFWWQKMHHHVLILTKDAPTRLVSCNKYVGWPIAHSCIGLSSSSGHVVLDPEYTNSSLFLHPRWLLISPSESPDFGWYARQPLSSPFLLTNTSIYGPGTPASRTHHPLVSLPRDHYAC